MFKLQKLSLDQVISKDILSEQLRFYWRQPKFLHRWVDPPVGFADVEPLLELASEAIVRGGLFNSENRSRLKRSGDVAFEWLNSLAEEGDGEIRPRFPNPIDEPGAFVRQLVGVALEARAEPQSSEAKRIDEIVDVVLQAHSYGENCTTAAQLIAEMHSILDDLKQLAEPHLTEEERKAADSLAARDQRPLALLRRVVRNLGSARHALVDLNQRLGVKCVGDVAAGDGSSTVTPPAKKSKQDNNNQQDESVQETATATPDSLDNATATEAIDEEQKQREEEQAAAEAAEAAAMEQGKLKIERVSKDAEQIQADLSKLREQIQQHKGVGFKSAKERLDAVNALQKKCIWFGEELMRDLLMLDEVTGAEELRPARKEKVKSIQSLLDEVDLVRKTLAPIYQDALKARHEEEEAEAEEQKKREEEEQQKKKQQQEKEAEAAAAAAAATDAAAAAASNRNTASEHQTDEDSSEYSDPSTGEPDAGFWSSVAMDAQLQVDERPNAYIIESYLPNMRDDDVHVELDDRRRTLTLSGRRLPSKKELQSLVAQLRHVDHRRLPPGYGDQRSLLIRLANGRFGTFRQQYRLPPDVNVANVQAAYTDGQLRVVMPKATPPPQRRRRVPQANPGLGGGFPFAFGGNRDPFSGGWGAW